ncbi:hypothetical protein [Patulibacter minatonensis]|uniref:hypothetical protein n=1 Tax=Patulibacter minatonensis TaxID=298163 RepID=UPI0004795998|nr:hypothetical protein [Patulibacter minatonensis]
MSSAPGRAPSPLGPTPAPDGPPVLRDRALWTGAAVGLVVSILLTVVRGDALWGSSEGVYALTARQVLDGDDLYGRLIGAQPPITLLAGIPALLVSDTIGAIHAWMGLLQLAGGVAAGVAVRRLTGSPIATFLAPLAAVSLPWAVNQHGVYTPELVGLPFLLGGAVAAARPRTVPLGAVLLALAVFVKLPFVLPAVLVVLACADRRRGMVWLAGTGIGLAGFFTLVFGTAMWEQVVLAQGQSGLHPWSALPGTVLQSVWSLLGLLAGCALLLRERRTDRWPRDGVQLRVSAALAAGAVLTWASSFKEGTSLNVLVPIELALIPLAATGFLLAWRRAGRTAYATDPAIRLADRGPLVRLGILLVSTLTLAQTVAVLVPPHDTFPWTRPGTPPAYGQTANTGVVDAKRRAAATCPPDAPFGGLAYYAFLFDRRMPDRQPDTFLTKTAPRLKAVRARMEADGPVCGG